MQPLTPAAPQQHSWTDSLDISSCLAVLGQGLGFNPSPMADVAAQVWLGLGCRTRGAGGLCTMAQHREGFSTQGRGCRQPFHHSSAQSRIRDAGPGVQAASVPWLGTERVQDTGLGVQAAFLPQLSTEQGLRHKAGALEQLGVEHHSVLVVLGLGGPHSVPKMWGLYQTAEHPSPEPSLWLQWDTGARVPGGSSGFARGTHAHGEERPVQGSPAESCPLCSLIIACFILLADRDAGPPTFLPRGRFHGCLKWSMVCLCK